MIRSLTNPKIKEVVLLNKKAAYRKESGRFVAEGAKLVSEAPRDLIESVFYMENFYAAHAAIIDSMPCEKYSVTEAAFNKICDTKTPQGIIAVVKKNSCTVDNIIRTATDGKNRPVIILDALRDPGNLGTIIRTAEAAGAAGIIAGPGCADITNPKTVRATMGSIFRMPFVESKNLLSDMDILDENGITVIAAALNGSVPYQEADFKRPCAIIIGNEGSGVSEALVRQSRLAVRIPMCGMVESLNASVAAALLMFEAVRQNAAG